MQGALLSVLRPMPVKLLSHVERCAKHYALQTNLEPRNFAFWVVPKKQAIGTVTRSFRLEQPTFHTHLTLHGPSSRTEVVGKRALLRKAGYEPWIQSEDTAEFRYWLASDAEAIKELQLLQGQSRAWAKVSRAPRNSSVPDIKLGTATTLQLLRTMHQVSLPWNEAYLGFSSHLVAQVGSPRSKLNVNASVMFLWDHDAVERRHLVTLSASTVSTQKINSNRPFEEPVLEQVLNSFDHVGMTTEGTASMRLSTVEYDQPLKAFRIAEKFLSQWGTS
jgi:hypothetical protein